MLKVDGLNVDDDLGPRGFYRRQGRFGRIDFWDCSNLYDSISMAYRLVYMNG